MEVTTIWFKALFTLQRFSSKQSRIATNFLFFGESMHHLHHLHRLHQTDAPSESWMIVFLHCSLFTFHLKQPKVNCCFSLMAFCHKLQVLLIKRGALLIFFFRQLAGPGDHIVWKKLAEISERLYTKDTNFHTVRYQTCMMISSLGKEYYKW